MMYVAVRHNACDRGFQEHYDLMSWQKRDARQGWIKLKLIFLTMTLWWGVLGYYLYMIFTHQRPKRPDWFVRPSRRMDLKK